MDIVGPGGQRWREVEVATTWSRRLLGLMGRQARPFLLPGRAVHGFWLRQPLWVVGVAKDGVVTDVRWLERRRLARLRAGVWVLELPPEADTPVVGDRLTILCPSRQPDDNARPSLPVRHTDRQPR